MAKMVHVRGKVKWFKHRTPEEYKGKSTWSHIMYPDEDSLEIIRELQAKGMKNLLKKDEDGYNIKWSRPTKQMYNGEWKDLDPPVVILSDGNMTTSDVGNGSVVTTRLETYEHNIPGSTKKATAARWLSSRVDQLVIYDKTNREPGLSKEENRAIQGFDKQQPSQSEGW